ncbi:MAG: radical SAM protein [Oscillospiraceae bacterium]|nr:radical SAM protein [Oscillospiraceae bacterium]
MTGRIHRIQKSSLADGAGIRASVYFWGCDLRCTWCEAPESFAAGKWREYTTQELADELLKDKALYGQGGVGLTGGEPLLQPDFACALCDLLRQEGVKVWLETAANVSPDIFSRVIDKCDGVMIDLKHHDNAAHLRGTGADMALILANIYTTAHTDRPMIVRVPVIPGFNDGADDIGRFAALLASLGSREVQLLPFHQTGEQMYQQLGLNYPYAGIPALSDTDLEPFASALRVLGFHVQIGGRLE